MNKSNYWDITNRPHTKRKLEILKEYLNKWATIIFAQYLNHQKQWAKTAYYIDCYAGRGMYHNNGIMDSINGSPLIALEYAKSLYLKHSGTVKLNCIFVEKNKKSVKELENFCEPYRKFVNIDLILGDINIEIGNIIEKIKYRPVLFFIDPWGPKEIKKETIKQIVSRGEKSPNDLILNYICGTSRVLAYVKKLISNNGNKEKIEKLLNSVKSLHEIESLTDSFSKKDKDLMLMIIKEIFADSKLNQLSVYQMLRPNKNETSYFLLFASRCPSAKKIIDHIFKNKDKSTYTGQMYMFDKEDYTPK